MVAATVRRSCRAAKDRQWRGLSVGSESEREPAGAGLVDRRPRWGRHDHDTRWAGALSVFLLQQGPGRGSAADRWSESGLYLRRVRAVMPGDHRRGGAADAEDRAEFRQDPDAALPL